MAWTLCKRLSAFFVKASGDNGKKIYTTKEGLSVFVYRSDLLKAKADCIVCPSNIYLVEHTEGAAVHIFKAAGKDTMRALCCDYLKQRGAVHVGQAITTAAGKLPFKHVIHAICPRWSDYKTNSVREVRKCATDLTSTVTSCFLEGENLGVKSLVLPCLSSGKSPFCLSQYHLFKSSISNC